MAIAHDAQTLGPTGTDNTTTGSYTTTGAQTALSHAGSASARAACVCISQTGTASDEVGGVTYGGAAMTRLRYDSESTEAGATYIYWKDGIATGTQNVVLTTTGSNIKKMVVSTMTVTAGQVVAVAGHNTGTSASVANPSWTITGLTASSVLQAYEVIHSGLQTMTTTPAASWTLQESLDEGAVGRGFARQAVASSGTSLACGWTAATADDFVGSSVAFIQAAPPTIAGLATGTGAAKNLVPQVRAVKATGTGAARQPAIVVPVTSPALELSAIGSFPAISPGDTINSVTITVNQFSSNTLMAAPTFELWDDSGTPAQIGAAQTGTASAAAAHTDTATFTGVTYPMLATLRVRIYAHKGTAPSGAIQYVNWTAVSVSYTPSTGASITAVLATGTGAAKNPSATSAVSVTAVKATGTGAALSSAFPGTTLASGTGAAQNATAATAVSVTAAAATGTGAALSTAFPRAVAATGTGAAQNPAAATATSVPAGLAAGTGAALSSAFPRAGAATGTGAVLGATASTTSSGTATAVPATGTGAALSSAFPGTVLPAGAGAAQNPAAGIGVTAILASAAATARNANPPVPATLAAATGTALNATAQTVSSGTATAVLATGAGAAQPNPAAAAGVNAVPAAGAGVAQRASGPVTIFRLWPATPGGTAISYSGNFISGINFTVTRPCWFQGYWWWVDATVQSVSPVKCALWSASTVGAGSFTVPGATVTSGTLTAGQWNWIPLPFPVPVSPGYVPGMTGGTAYGSGYTAAVGCNGAFPDTANYWGTGEVAPAGVANGPLIAYSGSAAAAPAPYTQPQGCFSTGGPDPALTRPDQASGTDNFWVDVQVTDTAPAGYTGSYRIWPSKSDANPVTGSDSAVAYNIAAEVDITTAVTLNYAHYYVPTGTLSAAGFATAADLWDISTGLAVASIPSPAWLTEAGVAVTSGNTGQWVKAAFSPGTVVQPGRYRVSVYNANGALGSWGAKDATSDYWSAGVGQAGITWGPLTAPDQASAQPAAYYPGTGTGTTGGQPVFAWSGSDDFPDVTTGTNPAQNYWIDLEATPPAGTGQAVLATGTGAALNANPPTPAVLATGTGAAQNATAQVVSSGTATAVLATGAGAAQSPAAAIGVTAVPATGTGAAQPPAITATASPAATLAAGTGAAIGATASTFTAGTANAAAATGTGAAQSPAAAIGVNAPAATGTGAAIGATASTAAFTNAQAGLATGTGTARNPSLTLTSNATAAAATGTGATQATPAIGAPAAAATGTGTARNPGRAAPAGLADATGTAAAAALAVAAQATAARALAAALNATGQGFIPPVYGTAVSGTSTTPAAHAVSGDSQAPYAQQGAYP